MNTYLKWIVFLCIFNQILWATEIFAPFEILKSERAEFEEGNALLDLNLPSNDSSAGTLDRFEKLASKKVTRDGRVYRSVLAQNGRHLFPKLPNFSKFSEELSDSNYSRKFIGDTSPFPYRAIGRTDVGCTGTMVSPRHVLTAGHCVYNLKSKKWYSNLSFSPGRNGSSLGSGTISWKNVYAPDGWTVDGDWEYDYAIIELNKPIGETVGWLEFRVAKTALLSETIAIAGYPSDKKAGTLWEATCPRYSLTTRKIYYQCETYNGMSGSSVRSVDKKSLKEVIEGVHGYGGAKANSGTRISEDIFLQLHHFLGSPPVTPPIVPPDPPQPPSFTLKTLIGSYKGNIENTNPNSNIPERALLTLFLPEGSSRLEGNLRLYIGDFGSHEFIEIKLSEVQFADSSRQLVVKTKEYSLLLIGLLEADRFSGRIHSAEMGELGKFLLNKVAY